MVQDESLMQEGPAINQKRYGNGSTFGSCKVEAGKRALNSLAYDRTARAVQGFSGAIHNLGRRAVYNCAQIKASRAAKLLSASYIPTVVSLPLFLLSDSRYVA